MSKAFKALLAPVSQKLADLNRYQDVLNSVTELGFRIDLDHSQGSPNIGIIKLFYPHDLVELRLVPVERSAKLFVDEDPNMSNYRRMQHRLLVCLHHIKSVTARLQQMELNDLVEV